MTSTESSNPESLPPSTSRVEPDRESGLTFLSALLAIRRQLYVLVLLAVVGVAAGALIGFRQPTEFSSTAMLTVRPKSPELQLQMPPLAASYAALAKTDAVAARYRAATGATSTNEQLLEDISVSNSAATPDIFLTAQSADAQSAQAFAGAWIQALITQVDATKGNNQPGGDLVVLAPASEGSLSSSRSVAKSSLIGLAAGLLLGLAAALAVDAARQRGSRAAVAARRGVPVVFVSRGPTTPFALDDGARVALALLDPASARPGRLVVVDLRNGPEQGSAADAVGRTLAAQGVPATVLRPSGKRDTGVAARRPARQTGALTSASLRSTPGVTVLVIESSASPARWALSANGRKEVARISETEQVIINVPFGSSRSDALAISAHAPGVIVVAGPRTRAKDFDEALALLTAVAPVQLVAIIIERRAGRSLPRRFGRPRWTPITPSTRDAVATSTTDVALPSDEHRTESADDRIGEGLSSAKH